MIRSQHYSIRALASRRTKPINIERLPTTREQVEFLERTAIGIFSDVVNSGHTFQEALAAIYLSGVENAVALMKEERIGAHGDE